MHLKRSFVNERADSSFLQLFSFSRIISFFSLSLSLPLYFFFLIVRNSFIHVYIRYQFNFKYVFRITTVFIFFEKRRHFWPFRFVIVIFSEGKHEATCDFVNSNLKEWRDRLGRPIIDLRLGRLLARWSKSVFDNCLLERFVKVSSLSLSSFQDGFIQGDSTVL